MREEPLHQAGREKSHAEHDDFLPIAEGCLYLSTGDTAEGEPPFRFGTAIGDALGLWALMLVTFVLVWFQLSDRSACQPIQT